MPTTAVRSRRFGAARHSVIEIYSMVPGNLSNEIMLAVMTGLQYMLSFRWALEPELDSGYYQSPHRDISAPKQ